MSEEGKHFLERTKLIVRSTSHLLTFIDLSFYSFVSTTLASSPTLVLNYARQQALAPGIVDKVKETPVEIDGLLVVAFAGRAVVTINTIAINVSPICFTISSKCLYYL